MPEPTSPQDGTRKSSRPPAPPVPPVPPADGTPTGTWNPPPGEPDVQLAVPPRIGRFEVKAVLGTGTYGRVFLAFDPQMHRQVAIKQPFGEGLKPEYRDDFLKEARAVAPLEHVNICPVYHTDTDAGLPYIVMRFVAGGTLKNYLDRHPGSLSVRRALIIARKIALGLEAAHKKGVIHRDLKPANVLIDDANSEVLITDFGLARIATHSQAAASMNRGAHGTPFYMPPEQWGSQAFGPITPAADVYSLGVILYEMLAGQTPFSGSHYELMTRHCMEAPRPPSEVRAGLNPRLDAICLKAMAKQPAERYPSARAFADAMTEYLRGDDVPMIDALPLGEELDEPPPPRPAPPPLPAGTRPVAQPKRDLSSPSAATGSAPDSTLGEKEIIRCPKCAARLEINKGLARITCPMCDLKFAVEAGRRAAGVSGSKEKPELREPEHRERRDDRREGRRSGNRRDDPRDDRRDDRDERRAERREERRVRREDDDDGIPRRRWLPAARGLRLVWVGLVVCAVFAVGLAAAAMAAAAEDSSSGSSSSASSRVDYEKDARYVSPSDSADESLQVVYVLCGFGVASGLAVMSLGRLLAARLPDGVGGGTAATLAAVAGWGAAGCAAVTFAATGWLMAGGLSRSTESTLVGAAGIAAGAGLLLLLVGEFAFCSYLGAVRRRVRGDFPRTLVTVTKVFLWVILACALIGGAAGGLLGTINEPSTTGNRQPPAVAFFALLTVGAGCLAAVMLPFWGVATLWLQVQAAVSLGRYANDED